MVGRAAQGNGPPLEAECRQNDIEQGGVFDEKLFGEPVLMRALEGEPCLQAGESRRCGGEDFRSPAQLPGLGNILCVKDGQQLAPRIVERVFERSRFGLRETFGNDDRFVGLSQIEIRDCPPHLLIFLLQNQFDVETICRIVQPVEGADKLAQRFRFAEHRHEHRINREFVGLEPRPRPLRCLPKIAKRDEPYRYHCQIAK
ncbi:MAG TPA: hypothetical protein VH933_05125 [Aestuariivirgaceae bacterium]